MGLVQVTILTHSQQVSPIFDRHQGDFDRLRNSEQEQQDFFKLLFH